MAANEIPIMRTAIKVEVREKPWVFDGNVLIIWVFGS